MYKCAFLLESCLWAIFGSHVRPWVLLSSIMVATVYEWCKCCWLTWEMNANDLCLTVHIFHYFFIHNQHFICWCSSWQGRCLEIFVLHDVTPVTTSLRKMGPLKNTTSGVKHAKSYCCCNFSGGYNFRSSRAVRMFETVVDLFNLLLLMGGGYGHNYNYTKQIVNNYSFYK